jgi:hypothetical protein
VKNKFLIIKDYNDFENTHYPIGYVDTKEDAISMCERLNSYHEIAKKVLNEMSNYVKPIRNEDLGLEKVSDWPRWKAGISEKDITKEMRDERNSIKRNNEEIEKRNSIKIADREDRINKAKKYFIDNLKYSEEIISFIKKNFNGLGYYHSDYCYSEVVYIYEEIEKLV